MILRPPSAKYMIAQAETVKPTFCVARHLKTMIGLLDSHDAKLE